MAKGINLPTVQVQAYDPAILDKTYTQIEGEDIDAIDWWARLQEQIDDPDACYVAYQVTGLGRTYRELGNELGVSHETVRLWHKRFRDKVQGERNEQ